MLQEQIPKNFESAGLEDELYRRWEASGFFNPDRLPGKRKKAFTIVMPPPNVTGTLHVGHAVMLAIEDTIIRFQRMRGKKTLWLPGTDHAAIATQSKVERLLREQEGKTKYDLGREAFLQRVETFVHASQDTIKNQVRKMGSSCDWSRERYTLDAPLNAAVTEAFIQMYNDGLIYRGDRIVNWDPQLNTTVSDDELEYREVAEPFYYFQYGPFVIATSRPETKFGDKYVVVHPDDERYAKYQHGQQFQLEWINGPITATLIKDEVIDRELGTGAMTITPWHDMVDFEIAERHHLDKEQIIDFDGKLLPIAGEFAGMSIADARKKIVAKLKEKGLLVKVDEQYRHNVAVNSRGEGKIEPQIKEQWFINVNKKTKQLGNQTIREKALAVVQDESVEIIPERFKKVYFHWLENLRDWCISRQIWFGHRIPAWYRTVNGKQEMYVGVKPPQGDGWQQDSDTLDTWFSSGLWTFSTLGWPQKTKDLKTFHPTALLETGYDILFFWVARMIIMSTYFMKEVPFKQVYLHGLVRDEQGRKMSKSLDNIIDPLDMIARFGADATRLSLMIGMTPGNDTSLSEAKIGGYRNFVNKLWNIARYILTSVESPRLVTKQPKPQTLADRWILSELNDLIVSATNQIEKYNLSAAGEQIYEFTWSKLADWYLETTKIKDQKSKNTDELLLYVLQTLLKLWHPLTPFITEHIWEILTQGKDDLLMIQTWPQPTKSRDKKAVKQFQLIQEVVTAIRSLRQESGVPPAQKIPAIVITDSAHQAVLVDQASVITTLARLDRLDFAAPKPAQALSVVVGAVEIYLPVFDTIDIAKELARLNKELSATIVYQQAIQSKLGNEGFVANAPKELVAQEHAKLAEQQQKQKVLEQQINSLS